MSAHKARRVIDQIRGRSYEETLMILELMPYRACYPIFKLVYSAAANASFNMGSNEANLVISKAEVNEEFIAGQLKNRVSFRKAMKKAIELTEQADTKGIQVQIARRIDGKEIARVEWIRKDNPPRALSDGCGCGSFFDNHVKTSKMVFKFLQTRINHAYFRKFFWNLNFGGSTRKSGFWRIHRILRPKVLFSR
ncbi:ribosomal protein L22 [Tanacetum coccineum]